MPLTQTKSMILLLRSYTKLHVYSYEKKKKRLAKLIGLDHLGFNQLVPQCFSINLNRTCRHNYVELEWKGHNHKPLKYQQNEKAREHFCIAIHT
jgi:hypothetical protein